MNGGAGDRPETAFIVLFLTMATTIRNSFVGKIFENKKYKEIELATQEFDQIVAAPYLVSQDECKLVHAKLKRLGLSTMAAELKCVWLSKDYLWDDIYPSVSDKSVSEALEVSSMCENEIQPKFEGKQVKRPVVVVDRASSPIRFNDKRWWKRHDRFTRQSRRKEEKDFKKSFPPLRCPFSQLLEKDCWCLHRKHAKECSLCGCMYFGDKCRDINLHNSYYDGDCSISCCNTPCNSEFSDEVVFEEQMPKIEFDPKVLINVYIKECIWNIHSMIAVWKYDKSDEVRGMCISLLSKLHKVLDLIHFPKFMGDRSDESCHNFGNAVERMFLFTSNIVIRLNQCNKIVNDNKDLYGIRPEFLAETKSARVLLGCIRTIVNESRGKHWQIEEQMQANGDPNFSMPKERMSTLVGFTNDKARDENLMFALGKNVNITNVLERCKIPSRLDVITSYTASVTAGTALARYRVSPNYCPRYIDSTVRTYNQTTLCNYANMYQFWKGSLIYTIEVVCTPLHMGQLFISFNPASIAAPNFTASSNNLFKIMDIKQKNRMDFEVEYVAETEYKKCVSSVSGPAVPNDPYINIANVGILTIFALSPLSAPPTVANQVDINVYVRAGENFTFKTPTNKTLGLKYYNVRGAVYEEMETSYDTELQPVTAQPMQGLVSRFEKFEIARAAKLQTADTSNIAMRRYPLSIGIAWDTTDTIAAPLSITSLPHSVLTAANLSINGLINYHSYFRGKFRMIFEMNAPPQYSGLLILMYVPTGVDYTRCSNATWQQFPHTFFNPAQETIAELEIPWSYVTPMESLDPNGSVNTMGNFYIIPWNNLQIPPTGVNTLIGTLSFEMIDPQIVLKRTNYTYSALEVEEQMEPVSGGNVSEPIKQTSDSALKSEDSMGVFQGKPTTMEGLMIQDHVEILSLLKRFDFSTTTSSTAAVTANWTLQVSLPPFFGTMHNFLRNSFAFSNGSNKISIIVPVGANRGVTLAAFPSYSDSSFSDSIINTPVSVSDNIIFYQGTSVWRPGLFLEHTIEVPYYHRDPVISIPSTGVVSQGEYANVTIASFNNDSATELFFQLAHAISDDFRLYFPIAYGQFQGPIPSLSERKKRKDPTGLDVIADVINRAHEHVSHLMPTREQIEAPNTFTRTLEQIRGMQALPDFPKEFAVQLPKPPVVHIPAPIVKHLLNKPTMGGLAAEGARRPYTSLEIKDLGREALARYGHHDVIGVLGKAYGMLTGSTRRRREVDSCSDCPLSNKWPNSLPIPMRVDKSLVRHVRDGINVEGPETEDIIRPDYDSVYVHAHEEPDKYDLFKKVFKSYCTHGKIEEQMPSNGFTATTTNSMTASQAFPGIFTTGVVNSITINVTAFCTSNLSTDLVDITYTIGNSGDSIAFILSVGGVSGTPVTTTFTYLATPINTLGNFSISAIGTGVVEHACNIIAYNATSPSSVVPVMITGQPIIVSEYGLFADEMEIEEQMPMTDPPDILSSEEEEEAMSMAERCCDRIVAGGRNAVSVFCEAFTGIYELITRKCSVMVKKQACERLRSRVQEMSTHVLDKILPVVIWIIDFISNLFVLFNTESAMMRTCVLTSLTAKCVLAYREGPQLVNKLEQLFGIVQEEGPCDEIGLPEIAGAVATAMVAGILGVLGFQVMSRDVTDVRKLAVWKFSESCAMVSKIGGAVRAVPTMWTAASSGIKAAVKFFIEGPECFKNWEEVNHGKIVDWQKNYDYAIANNEFVGGNLYSKVNGVTNIRRLNEMTDFAHEIRAHGGPNKDFNRVWLSSANNLLKVHAVADKLLRNVDGRSEPIGIMVRGEAGLGKSLLFTEFFPHAVMLTAGLSKDLKETRSRIYNKSMDVKSDYWDNYMGFVHSWVNYDDFGQSKTEEDVSAMFNIISSSDCPVNMADLVDKGQLFNSDFVCCTTNLANFTGFSQIRSPKALARRFPVSLQARVNPEFQIEGREGRINNVCQDDTINSRPLDFQKMMAHMVQAGKSAAEFYNAMDAVWSFHRYDFLKGETGRRLTMQEVIADIVGLYKAHKQGRSDFSELLEGLSVNEEMPARRPHLHRFWNSNSDEEDEEESGDDEGERMCKRFRFIQRVRVVNSDISKIPYDKARDFLREVQNCDYLTHFGVTRSELGSSIDRDNFILNESSNSKESFLVLISRLRAIKELPTAGKVEWKGLVAHCLKWMGIIASGAAIALLLKKMLTMLFSKVLSPLVSEQGPNYDKGSRKMHTKAPSRLTIRNQALHVVQEMDQKQTVVSNNIRFIQLIVPTTGEVLRMQTLALDSRYIVIPEHYYVAYCEYLKKGVAARFELEKRVKGVVESTYIPILINEQNSVQLEGVGAIGGHKLDARLVYLSGQVCTGAKSIWSHMMNSDDLSFYANSEQRGYILAPQSGLMGQRVIMRFKDWLPYKNRVYGLGRCAINTVYGECGRPYVHESLHSQRCLIGIHTLGIKRDERTNVAFSPLIRESVDIAKNIISGMVEVTLHVEPFIVAEMPASELTLMPTIVTDMWETPSMPLLGTLSLEGIKITHFTPVDTMFIPLKVGDVNFIHSEWKNEFTPSVKKLVTVGDKKISPLITGAQKYANVASILAPTRYCTAALRHYLSRIPRTFDARTLTFDESLNGYGSMLHLVMKTGAGYWVEWFKHGKEEIFVPKVQKLRADGSMEVTEYEWSDKAKTFVVPIWRKTIVDFYDECDRDVSEGKQMKTFWVSTLKDELVSFEKARIGKTRVFEQPCIIYTLLCRKYFGHFAENFKRHAGLRLHHGIGQDQSVVWGRYWELLNQHGKNGFDIDYKNYDGTVQPAAFEFFLHVTDSYYGLKDQKARHSLIRTLQNSVHLIGSVLAESSQGNKSGNPLTDMFNSITNVWLVYIVYQWTREIYGLSADMASQPDNFDFLTYGDDLILNATDECLEYFNRETFAELASLLGMSVTAADKSAELRPFDPMTSLTFLKCPFEKRYGYVAAPLPLKVIHRQLMWETKFCVGKHEIFKDRIKNGLDMIAHHGYDEYMNLRRQLRELGVNTEDRFIEWEQEMRDKQLTAEVEDGVGRYYVEADEAYLMELEEIEPETNMEYVIDDWLFGEELDTVFETESICEEMAGPDPLTLSYQDEEPLEELFPIFPLQDEEEEQWEILVEEGPIWFWEQDPNFYSDWGIFSEVGKKYCFYRLGVQAVRQYYKFCKKLKIIRSFYAFEQLCFKLEKYLEFLLFLIDKLGVRAFFVLYLTLMICIVCLPISVLCYLLYILIYLF
nr:MAG: polyprotein [Wufeng shrew picornavirus 6]